MKVAVQFTIDEGLLGRIDRDPDVKKNGRSAFLRRAAESYLKQKASQRIRDEYRGAYAVPPFPDDFGAWPPEVDAWPKE